MAQLPNVKSKLSQAIKNDTAFVRDLMPTMKTNIDSIKLDMDRAQFDALRAWISPTDFVAQQSDILRRRYAGTGQWFLDLPEFVDWRNGSIPNETLLCTGIPGAGKTMLVAVTIDHLSAKVQAPAIGIAWLYCSYKSRVEQTVEALLQAILLQLVRTETPGIVQLAKQLQQTHSSCGSRPSQHDIYKTLEAACAELTTVYIVIDALDECPVDNGSRRQLLAHLNQLQKSADVRLMVTSRRIPDIIEHFQDAARVEIRAHDQDIRQFLTGQLGRLPRCVQRDLELQLMVQEKVAEATDGM
jgi:Cdc6-like AAA superfamily ATPase